MPVLDSGTATPANATETDIYETTLNADGTYEMHLDMSDMTLGDDVILRAYAKVVSGGAYVLAVTVRCLNVMGIPYVIFPPIRAPYQIKWTYERVSGVVDSIPWRVDSL